MAGYKGMRDTSLKHFVRRGPNDPPDHKHWAKGVYLDLIEGFIEILQTVSPPNVVYGWSNETLAIEMQKRFPDRACTVSTVRNLIVNYFLSEIRDDARNPRQRVDEQEMDRQVKHLFDLAGGRWGTNQITAQLLLDGLAVTYNGVKSAMHRLGIAGKTGQAGYYRPHEQGLSLPARSRDNGGTLLKDICHWLQQPEPYPERWSIANLAKACASTPEQVTDVLRRHALLSYQQKRADIGHGLTTRELLTQVEAIYNLVDGIWGRRKIQKQLLLDGYFVVESDVKWALDKLGLRGNNDSRIARSYGRPRPGFTPPLR